MLVVFLLATVVGVCYLVPIFCAIFPKFAIPLIYLHYIQSFQKNNFSHFPSFGLSNEAASNFYIQSDLDGTPLGVWHIQPNVTEEFATQRSTALKVNGIDRTTPVFLYFHGMAFNRAYHHRVGVYKLLSRLGYHVMTVDYRGFGNSGGAPNGEADIVADAISLLRYARSVAPHSPIFIWGSSLGTGITGSMMRVINETGTVRPPEGIVLDAPFTNVLAAAYHSPQGKAMRIVVALRLFLKHIFESLDISYDSEANFQLVNCPILILHSADDGVVPIQLGQSLYTTLKRAKIDVTFENLGFQGFGHDRNHEHPKAPALIRDFVNRALSMLQ